jgi:hypothetical protein
MYPCHMVRYCGARPSTVAMGTPLRAYVAMESAVQDVEQD